MVALRALFARPRVVWLPIHNCLADLVVFGRYNHLTAQFPIPRHQHAPGVMEICCLVKGRQTYRIGRRDYRLSGGDVCIVFPNELHGTAGAPQEKGVLYWMQLQLPATPAPFLGLSPEHATPLVQALWRIKPRQFHASPKMKELLDALFVTHHRPWSPLRTTQIANLLTAFLVEVLECAHRAPTSHAHHWFHKVIRHIEEHLTEPLTVPNLATCAGVSVTRFEKQFKAETGLPPGEYVLRAKISAAQQRLTRPGTKVTDVAHEFGFSSSQYFATVFKRYTGQCPTRDGTSH